MSKFSFKWITVLILTASLILSGCAPAATPAPAVTEAPAATMAAAVTEAPAATMAPAATEAPAATMAPAATEAAATSAPAAQNPDLGGKTVTVAVENAYPPFNSIDQKTNQGVGWDYDTLAEICKRINCKPDFKQASWDGVFSAMHNGEYDMLADGVTITPTRTQVVDFSLPYVTVSQMLLVRNDETRTIDQLKADPKAIVGTQLGTTNEIVAKKNFPTERVKSFDDFGAAVLALLSKDIDGVVIDNVSASGFMGQNQGKMKVDGVLTSDEKLGFVFPPKSPLKDAVNAALSAMIADGTLEALNTKWGLTIPPSP